jgi:hypothetical protein
MLAVLVHGTLDLVEEPRHDGLICYMLLGGVVLAKSNDELRVGFVD